MAPSVVLQPVMWAAVLILGAIPGFAQEPGDTVLVAVLEDWPPHYELDDEGRPSGFAVDVVRAVTDHTRRPVRFVSFSSFPDAIEGLRNGSVDVIPDFGAIPSRIGEFAFTRPFDAFHVALVVRSSDPKPEASDDFAGRRIGVVQANVGVELVSERYPQAQPVVFGDPEGALFELLAVGIDAVVYPEEVLRSLAREAGLEDRITTVMPPLMEVPRAMGVRSGDTVLLADLNDGVEALVGTERYRNIYERWFGEEASFWTVQRVAGLGGVLLLLILAGMAVWRYRSVAGMARDLARTLEERDAARAAGRLEEERFRTLVETSYEGIVMADARGSITFANPRVCELLGIENDDLVGTSIFAWVNEDDHDRLREGIQRRQQGIPDSYEINLDRPDDAPLKVLMSVAPLTGPDGSFAGSVATMADITERERLEHQLRQSQKLEAVGRLAGGIAHDFNNLLTVILSQTDLVLFDLDEGDPVAEDVDMIRDAASRAAALTSQLLSFSRDRVLQPRVLNLCEVVSEMADLLERVITEDVRIVLDLAGDVPPVRLDRTGLEQAVLNLAVNAKDAMPDGGTFTLKTYQEQVDEVVAGGPEDLPNGVYAVLVVSDSGVGMDEETRRRAFEPFFTTKETGQGTGLGLAMIHGFVNQSGGTVHVESEKHRGTTFRLRFPAADGEPEDVSESPAPPERPDPSSGAILVVEDEESVRAAITKILRRSGYRVVATDRAEVAWERLEADGDISMVLTDLVLPGMSGRELVERIRASRPGMPFLIMSGYAEASPDHPGDLSPDIPFLQKPFEPGTLLETVERVLGGRPPGR